MFEILTNREKNENFVGFFFYIFDIFLIFILIFLIFAQNIDCGYTLEPLPRGGGSNEYPQSMFWNKNKKYKP